MVASKILSNVEKEVCDCQASFFVQFPRKGGRVFRGASSFKKIKDKTNGYL